MVKGISKQVIVIPSPDPKLFEQAIFILKEGAAEITEEMLLKEASRAIRHDSRRKRPRLVLYGPVWACGGAVITGLVWLLTALL